MTERPFSLQRTRLPRPTAELAQSRPRFLRDAGRTPATATPLADVTTKQTIFGMLDQPGSVHVFRADCPAGQRLRAQVFAPSLQGGRALVPALALVAQGVRTGVDGPEIPVPLPAGYGAVSVAPAAKLADPLVDRLTGAQFFAGPLVDEVTLVGGRCYVVVWSPDKQPGKYLLQVGYAPSRVGRLAIATAWWRIRGWFGLSRTGGVVALLAAALVIGLVLRLLLRRPARPQAGEKR